MSVDISNPKIFKLTGLPSDLKDARKLFKTDTDSKQPIYLVTQDGQLMVMKIYPNLNSKFDFFYQNEVRFKHILHPHILPIQQNGEFEPSENADMSYKFTLSPYCKNLTFHDLLAQRKIRLEEVVLRTYFHQMVEGLEHLHSIGISHLDLKPENILLDDDFQLKIFDFDLSHQDSDEKLIVRGSFHYRAPELVQKENCKDPKLADIYSLGILLFVFHNGRTLPFFEDRHLHLRKAFDDDPKKFWGEFKRTFVLLGSTKWSDSFKELFTGLVRAEPEKRFTFNQIKECEWYKQEVLTPEELKIQMNKYFN